MKKFLIPAVIMMIVASFAYSVQAQNTSSDITIDDPKNDKFQLIPCTGAGYDSQGKKIGNECDFSQLLNLINRVIKFLLYLSIPLVMGIIVYTAFRFITANGDPGKLADAKKMLIPVAIGLFWVLAAYIVVYTVLDKLLADKTNSGARNILDQYFNK